MISVYPSECWKKFNRLPLELRSLFKTHPQPPSTASTAEGEREKDCERGKDCKGGREREGIRVSKGREANDDKDNVDVDNGEYDDETEEEEERPVRIIAKVKQLYICLTHTHTHIHTYRDSQIHTLCRNDTSNKCIFKLCTFISLLYLQYPFLCFLLSLILIGILTKLNHRMEN